MRNSLPPPKIARSSLNNLSVIAIITMANDQKLYFTDNSNITFFEGNKCCCALNFSKLDTAYLQENEGAVLFKIYYDLRNYYLEGATIEIKLCINNTEPVSFMKGFILDVKTIDCNISVLKIASLFYKLRQGIGEMFSPLCRAELGDDKCAVNLIDYTFTGKVDAIISPRTFNGTHKIQKSGFYNNGIIFFADGANKKLRLRILIEYEGQITLMTNPPYSINKTESYSIIAGCNKTLLLCKEQFKNVINFRGEPFIQDNSL